MKKPFAEADTLPMIPCARPALAKIPCMQDTSSTPFPRAPNVSLVQETLNNDILIDDEDPTIPQMQSFQLMTPSKENEDNHTLISSQSRLTYSRAVYLCWLLSAVCFSVIAIVAGQYFVTLAFAWAIGFHWSCRNKR